MNQQREFNTRVLVIDDEESVRDSFGLALGPKVRHSQELLDAAAALFDDEPPIAATVPYNGLEFQLDTARTGREGFTKVEVALAEDRPYAVVFVDMRMPGWDGLKTVEQIRSVDLRCEIIFVTAYSEQPLEYIVQSVGTNIGYFLKPFANDEVKQMATKAVIDWNKAREMERLLRTFSALDSERGDLESLLADLLAELCLWMGTDSGLLVQITDEGATLRTQRGSRAGALELTDLAIALANSADDEPVIDSHRVILPIKGFGCAVVAPGDTVLTPERQFLLRVFLEHASLSIRNTEARQELAQARRLAAIGEALGCVVHDIRGPLGNAQLLLDYLADGRGGLYEPAEVHELIRASLIQAQATVNDTLDCVRGEMRIAKREVELADALRQPLKLIGLGLERLGIELDVRIPSGLRARADPLPLVRALHNLATNAGEALGAVGTARAPQRVEIGAREARGGEPGGNGAVIWVADNGTGIPDEVRANLFEPFVTVGKASGTGLGLAVVRLVAEAHGGSVEVHSDESGTRFELYLP